MPEGLAQVVVDPDGLIIGIDAAAHGDVAMVDMATGGNLIRE